MGKNVFTITSFVTNSSDIGNNAECSRSFSFCQFTSENASIYEKIFFFNSLVVNFNIYLLFAMTDVTFDCLVENKNKSVILFYFFMCCYKKY